MTMDYYCLPDPWPARAAGEVSQPDGSCRGRTTRLAGVSRLGTGGRSGPHSLKMARNETSCSFDESV
jgi:hypothetical protein